MNKLSTAERAKVIAVLVEGNSLRATARITGVARMTVEKLLRDLGTACARFHDATVRNLKSERVQCDEIWSFVGAKEKNVTPEQKAQGWGDIWTSGTWFTCRLVSSGSRRARTTPGCRHACRTGYASPGAAPHRPK